MDSYRASHSSIVSLVAVVSIITIGLHALGGVPGLAIDWDQPLTWIERADPADTIGAVLRYTGLGVGHWVLTTTALYYVTGLRDRRRRPRLVTLLTLPPVRRLVDRALATSLVLTIAAAPVGSLHAEGSVSPEPPPVVFELDDDGIPVPHVGSTIDSSTVDNDTVDNETSADENDHDVAETSERPADESSGQTAANDSTGPSVAASVAPPVVVSAPTTANENDAGEPEETTHAVTPGDSLWTISAAHLGALVEHNPSESEIANYWRAVVASNRGTLRSGDPNLIYPGEIVTLPAPEGPR